MKILRRFSPFLVLTIGTLLFSSTVASAQSTQPVPSAPSVQDPDVTELNHFATSTIISTLKLFSTLKKEHPKLDNHTIADIAVQSLIHQASEKISQEPSEAPIVQNDTPDNNNPAFYLNGVAEILLMEQEGELPTKPLTESELIPFAQQLSEPAFGNLQSFFVIDGGFSALAHMLLKQACQFSQLNNPYTTGKERFDKSVDDVTAPMINALSRTTSPTNANNLDINGFNCSDAATIILGGDMTMPDGSVKRNPGWGNGVGLAVFIEYMSKIRQIGDLFFLPSPPDKKKQGPMHMVPPPAPAPIPPHRSRPVPSEPRDDSRMVRTLLSPACVPV